MKSVYSAVYLLFFLFIINSCNGFWGITGEGELVQEEFVVNTFTSIESGISAEIHLTQDSDQKIVIEAQQNIIDNIRLKVNGKRLKILFDKNILSHKDITVHIYNPEFERIALSGSGKIINDESLIVDLLELDISGSGNIELEDVEGDELKMILSGSGKIKIDEFKDFSKFATNISGSGKIEMDAKGTLESHDIKISGSGKMKAYKSPTNNVDINISGSGNCEVWVLDQLDVKISGSGDVYYKGSPQINSNISGSGNIINDN